MDNSTVSRSQVPLRFSAEAILASPRVSALCKNSPRLRLVASLRARLVVGNHWQVRDMPHFIEVLDGGPDLAADRKGSQAEGPCCLIVGPLDKAPGIRDLVDPIAVDGKSLT